MLLVNSEDVFLIYKLYHIILYHIILYYLYINEKPTFFPTIHYDNFRISNNINKF